MCIYYVCNIYIYTHKLLSSYIHCPHLRSLGRSAHFTHEVILPEFSLLSAYFSTFRPSSCLLHTKSLFWAIVNQIRHFYLWTHGLLFIENNLGMKFLICWLTGGPKSFSLDYMLLENSMSFIWSHQGTQNTEWIFNYHLHFGWLIGISNNILKYNYLFKVINILNIFLIISNNIYKYITYIK